MANTFKSYGAKAVGTAGTTVLTGAASTQTTLIGVTCANIVGSSIYVDIVLTKNSVDYYIVKGAMITPGNSLIAIGGDQKVVVETGDLVKVVSNVDSSVDVIVSALEITPGV